MTKLRRKSFASLFLLLAIQCGGADAARWRLESGPGGIFTDGRVSENLNGAFYLLREMNCGDILSRQKLGWGSTLLSAKSLNGIELDRVDSILDDVFTGGPIAEEVTQFFLRRGFDADAPDSAWAAVAQTYDLLPSSDDYRALFRRIDATVRKYSTPEKPNLTFIEEGMGTGSVVYFLLLRFPFAKVLGLDVDHSALLRASSKAKALTFEQFFRGSLRHFFERVDLRDYRAPEFADYSINIHSLYYIPSREKRALVLRAQRSRLKKGGRAIFNERVYPDFPTDTNPSQEWLRRQLHSSIGHFTKPTEFEVAILAGLVSGALRRAKSGGVYDQVKPPTADEWIREVLDAGFVLEEIDQSFGDHSLFMVLRNP